MPVARADLGPLAPLAEGGNGRVYRADGFTLPDDPVPLAYKEFTKNREDQARAAGNAVVFRAGLGAEDRADLDSCCAWPRALVESESGEICGLLMPLVPPDFFCEKADPDTGDLVSRPRDMQWLITGAEVRRAARIDLREIDIAERFLLLARLVYAVGRLHRHGWVYGDLSFKNVVFALDPPRVLLIDCDGAAALADQNRHQSSTPFWDPPECPLSDRSGQRKLQNTASDTYKLGLAVLRCLTPGKGAASARKTERFSKGAGPAGPVLDPMAIRVVARALGDDPGARPTARELYACLRAVARQHATPPEITWARLTTPVVLRGQSARIEWRIGNAGWVTVTAGPEFTASIVLAERPDGYAFPPDGSGAVRVRAANRFGTVTADLGDISVLDPPPFTISFDGMPGPWIPPLKAISLDSVAEAMAGGPGTRGLLPEGPAISLNPPTPRLPDVPPVHVPRSPLTVLPSAPAALTWPGIKRITSRVTASVWKRLNKDLDGQQKGRA